MDNPTLLFFDWYAVYPYGYDGYNVKYSTNDGATWTIVDPEGGYNYGSIYGLNYERGYSGSQTSWALKKFTIPVTNGTVFKLRWHFGSYTGTMYPGVFIDDFAGLGFRYWIPDNDLGVIQILDPAGFWGPHEPLTPRARVTNYGLLTQIDAPLRFVVRDSATGTAVYDQTVNIPSLSPGESLDVDLPEWTDPDYGVYYDTMRTTLSTDEKPNNDGKSAKLMVLDSVGGEYSYADDTPENGWAWYAAGNGWGVKFQGTGGLIAHVDYFFYPGWPSPGGHEFRIWVLDGSGSGGLPGNLLFDSLVTDAPTGEYAVYDLTSAGISVSGTWYVFYIQTQAYPNCLGMGADYTSPITIGNDFEYFSGVFGPDVNTDGDGAHDWMIRCGTKAYSRDCGIVSINVPPAVLDSGSVVYPQVVAGNMSFMPRTFDLIFNIKDGSLGTVYSDSFMSVSLPKLTTQTFDFDRPWTADPLPAGSNWTREAYVIFSPDYFPGNDTMRGSLFVRFFDIRCDTIMRPNPSESPGAVPVIIRVRNVGNLKAYNVEVHGTITGTTGDTVYDDWRTYDSLRTGQVVLATLPSSWYVSGGQYVMTARVVVPGGDMDANDDVKTRTISIGNIDAALDAFVKPLNNEGVDTVPFVPIVRVKNYSDVIIDIPTIFTFTEASFPVYSDTQVATGVPAGGTRNVLFDPFPLSGVDSNRVFDMEAKVMVSDPNPGNDIKTGTFHVTGGGTPPPPGPWEPMADIPSSPSGKNPKYGSCMAGLNATGKLYFLKASKSPDFYAYTPEPSPGLGTWEQLTAMPLGDKATGDGKDPKRGAAIAAYEPKTLYVARGNNTYGFWKFEASADTNETLGWTKLQNIPPGAKKVKYGTGLAPVTKGGNDYLFCMKGAKTTEFYLFDLTTNAWSTPLKAPATGPSGKIGYKKGSCLAYDGSEWVYVLKGYYGDFFRYNVEMDSWDDLSQYNYKLMLNREGKKKKPKDGAALVYNDDNVYMLKGGNTNEVWRYSVASDSWTQMDETWDILPGASGKKVKDGGAMVSFGLAFYASKGRNTPEFYKHCPPTFAIASTPATPTENEGAMGKKLATGEFKLLIAPNPAINVTAVRYNLPVAGPVTFKLYNVTGALVKSYANTTPTKDGVLMLDTKTLPSGVYILRFNSGDIRVTRKLVLEK
jgi:hypothetical protein